MRFAVSGSSGQVLAYGKLFIQTDEGGQRLCFCTDRGTVIAGGMVDPDGDLSNASQELFQEFLKTWGMMGVTLTSQGR
ncbi:hypothetical protein [Phormidesmis priestleyi]